MRSEYSPEEIKLIINDVAQLIKKTGLETIFVLFLDSIKPASGWVVPTFMVTSAPVMFGLELFGIESWKIGFILSQPEYMEELIKKVESSS